MRVQRLRPAHDAVTLQQIYERPHDSSRWHDHNIRVAVTSDIARGPVDVESVADLSCGDARIARSVGAKREYLGDFAPGYEFQGPIEKTIFEIPEVDMLIMSETLEHLDDPGTVLQAARKKATKYLVLSTPLEAWDESNLEHYWAWDKEYLETILQEAGWEPGVLNILDMRRMYSPYCFGIWLCR